MRRSLKARPSVERLEDRLVPSVTASETSSGILTFQGDKADGNTVHARDMGNGTVMATFGNSQTGFVRATFNGVVSVRAILGDGAGNDYNYQYLSHDITTNQEVFTGIGNADSVFIGATKDTQTTTGVNILVHTKSPTEASLPSPSPFFSGDTVRVQLANVADNAKVNITLDGKHDRGQNQFTAILGAHTIGTGATVNITELAGKSNDRLTAEVTADFNNPDTFADNTPATDLKGSFNIDLEGGGGAVSEKVLVNIAKAPFSFPTSTVTENGGGGAAFVAYEQNDLSNRVLFANLNGGGNRHSTASIDFDAGQGVLASGFGSVVVS
jgi:hypothetical protein